MSIIHYNNCNADYSEKIKGEKPQEVTKIPLPGGQYALVCVDCGASEVIIENETQPTE